MEGFETYQNINQVNQAFSEFIILKIHENDANLICILLPRFLKYA